MGYISRVLGDFELLQGETHAETLRPEQVFIGPLVGAVTGIVWDRPEVSDTETTVTVPGDEDTVQDALRKVPRRLAANYTIEVDETGDYSGEDWVIPPVVSLDLHSATEGGNSRLMVTRQGGSGQLNPNSVYGIGGTGQGNVVVSRTYPVGVNPYDDENAVFAFYGGGTFKLHRCGVGGSVRQTSDSVGVMSYASKVKVETAFDWGTDLVTLGGTTKQGGILFVDAPGSGSVTDHAWQCSNGLIQHARNGPTSGNQFAADPNRNGGTVSHLLPMVDRSGSFFDALKEDGNGNLEISDPANNKRLVVNGDGTFDFFNASGTKVASMSTAGDLTLLGGLTENGSP